MKKFGKIGDRVVLDTGRVGVITDNNIYYDNMIKIKIINHNNEIITIKKYITNLTIIENKKEMKNKKETKNNKWQFKILSNVDIDYEIIQRELTRKNPIALITFGEEKFVCIHKSIIDKSAICRILLPNRIEKIVDKMVIYKVAGNFSEWIKWAKEVKNAKWPNYIKNKQTVTVVLPKI